jgi:large subunit ribosomal protein L3
MSIDGIIARKIGMTQIFLEDGKLIPVTAVKAGPCTVTSIKDNTRDGYTAVQLGFEDAKHVSKGIAGHLKPVAKLFRFLREVPANDTENIELGQEIGAETFSIGERVDVIGISKGRGFAGTVKRHHFRGGPKTHGQSDRERAPGSIGGGTFPGHVWKGTPMAGHMGNARSTIRNIEIIAVDPERNLLFVKGAVPGASKGIIQVRRTNKKGK